jgi:Ice-binding-like/Stigma-specific protein, Stig1
VLVFRTLRTRIARLFVLASGLALAATACASRSPREDTSAVAQSATAPGLGTTQSFAVLAGTTVTNTGPTIVTGDLGVSPGSAVTGFPPGLVMGGSVQAATAAALQAQSDATTAYNALAGQACNQSLTGQDLGGLTLTPGTYCFSSSAQLTGTLTLNAQGDPGAVFIFQIGSTLTTASNSSVRFVNGGNLCNVYWQVGSSATIGTGTTFVGSILALTSITLTTGASVFGRALARNAAVTMDTNTVSAASCQGGVDAGGGGGDAGGTGGDAGGGTGGDAGGGSDSGDGGAGGDDAGLNVDSGRTFCGDICVDLQTDALNCGSCGHACGPAESCAAGICCTP